MSDASHLLRNLLARIFRDGGQRADQCKSLNEAVALADELVATYIAQSDEAPKAYAAGVRRGRADMREDAIRALCIQCREGMPLAAPSNEPTYKIWTHRSIDGLWAGDCAAHAIRALPDTPA